MIRATLPCRPAGLVLGLIALSSTAGCAHFREAHERVLREQGQDQHVAAPAAQAAPAATAAPTPPPPAPTVAVMPAPAAPVAPNPEPTQTRKAEKAAQKAQAAQEAAQIKADRRAERAKSKAEAKLAQAAPTEAVRQPVFEAPVKASPVPVAPAPAPAPIAPPPPPPVASPPADVATAEPGNAIVMFANVPGARCGACETIKLSVQPSGKVLIERGHGAEESWRYKRSIAHVRPQRAAAFAARLAALRPVGKQSAACPAPTTQDQGFNIEWIEAERHDQLSIAPGCGNASLATLMQAPDLLGLHLVFPWSSAR